MRLSEGEITHQPRPHHALVGSDDEHFSSQPWARQARAFAKMYGSHMWATVSEATLHPWSVISSKSPRALPL